MHPTKASSCLFGLARCDITPPVGMYHRTWGAARQDVSTGVHQPLEATALALHPRQGPVRRQDLRVLIALDHAILLVAEMNELLGHLEKSTGLGRDQVKVSFSHTHAVGLLERKREDLPGGKLIVPYLEELGEKVAKLVRQAEQALAPASITYVVGRCDLAAQRDFWDEMSGQFVCGYNPGACADDTVLVGAVRDEQGRMRAVLVNYACHPTTLAWDNTLVSPDFPGTLRAVVEREAGGTCVFIQGASGDLGPRHGFVGDPKIAEKNGRQLGYAVLSALEKLPPPDSDFVYVGPVISGATLGAWEYRPFDERTRASKARWSTREIEIALAYRTDKPTREGTEAELRKWRQREVEAERSGDTAAFRDAHAMVERMRRWQTRLPGLPEGATFPFPVAIWQLGDALWVLVEGELYQHFQTTLRAEFPGRPIVVGTITNGSRCIYLPTKDTYGKGIYQESIAVLAPGTLEELTEQVVGEIRQLV